MWPVRQATSFSKRRQSYAPKNEPGDDCGGVCDQNASHPAKGSLDSADAGRSTADIGGVLFHHGTKKLSDALQSQNDYESAFYHNDRCVRNHFCNSDRFGRSVC